MNMGIARILQTSAWKGATQLNSCTLELHLDSLARDSVVALISPVAGPFSEKVGSGHETVVAVVSSGF